MPSFEPDYFPALGFILWLASGKKVRLSHDFSRKHWDAGVSNGVWGFDMRWLLSRIEMTFGIGRGWYEGN